MLAGTTACGRDALGNPCISQVVILNGVCKVKNPGILRRLRMTEWALCRASLVRSRELTDIMRRRLPAKSVLRHGLGIKVERSSGIKPLRCYKNPGADQIAARGLGVRNAAIRRSP